MELKNEMCSVKISVDETYVVGFPNSRRYAMELNPGNYEHGDLYRTFSIHIDLFNREMDIALVGDFYSADSDCAVLDGKILTVLQNDAILQIDVYDGTLICYKEIECFGCTFGLYRMKNGYIIYGEIEIIMLDFDFNKVWVFSGRDIFVSQTRGKAFVLGEHSIKLHDWEGNYYELDFMGKLLSKYP